MHTDHFKINGISYCLPYPMLISQDSLLSSALIQSHGLKQIVDVHLFIANWMLKSMRLFIFQHLTGITSSQNFNQLAMMCVCQPSHRIHIHLPVVLFCSVVNYSLMPFASYFHFQKIIQSYVKTPILHCYFGTLRPTEIDANAKYVFILRKGASKIGSFQCYFAW